MSIRIHQGSTPKFLQKTIQTNPLTTQLDVVFTNSEELTRLLSALRTSYYRSTMTFAEVFSAFDAGHSTLAYSISSQDAWSIDHRAILTLHLARDTYERLGIVGTPSGSKDIFVITLDLHNSSRQAVRSRDCLRQWDARRAEAGWDVFLSSSLPSGTSADMKRDVNPLTRAFHAVHVPSRILPLIKNEDAVEDLSALFEWVGMASLGSQRLQINDDVNPYVASCSFPTSWSTGSLTHIRWAGLLTPTFVQSVLDACLRCTGLAALTAAPVFRERGVVWTLVVSKEFPKEGDQRTSWILAECHQ